MHHIRWRKHGDPLSGGTTPGAPLQFYTEVVLKHDDPIGCLSWPFATGGKGYAHIRIKGKSRLVSRLVCEARNGPPPDQKSEARHTCGNGHLACVNQHHLI